MLPRVVQSLVYKVTSVRSCVSQKKVVRARALLVIAVMQDTHAFGDRTIMKLPGNAVREERFVIGYFPISTTDVSSSPFPTPLIMPDNP
jgi:hypothetical protein